MTVKRREFLSRLHYLKVASCSTLFCLLFSGADPQFINANGEFWVAPGGLPSGPWLVSFTMKVKCRDLPELVEGLNREVFSNLKHLSLQVGLAYTTYKDPNVPDMMVSQLNFPRVYPVNLTLIHRPSC